MAATPAAAAAAAAIDIARSNAASRLAPCAASTDPSSAVLHHLLRGKAH